MLVSGCHDNLRESCSRVVTGQLSEVHFRAQHGLGPFLQNEYTPHTSQYTMHHTPSHTTHHTIHNTQHTSHTTHHTPVPHNTCSYMCTVDSIGAFTLRARFDLDSVQLHRNPIQSTWILFALTKLPTARNCITSRTAYVFLRICHVCPATQSHDVRSTSGNYCVV